MNPPGDYSDQDWSAMVEEAEKIVREIFRASTSSLQRRLRIGYTTANRLMDELELRGVVGPFDGTNPREVLISFDVKEEVNP